MFNLSELIKPLIALARQAGDIILDIYQQSKQCPVHHKPDHSPVTQADLMSDEALRLGLHKILPQLPYLSEESEAQPWSLRRQWSECWMIDPLDGTREFLRHSGEFTINIALIAKHKAILGMIYVPVTGECYYGFEQGGAYKVGTDDRVVPIRVRPWQVNHTAMLASRGAKEEVLQQYFGDLGAFEMIRMSSALKFCKVAEGVTDLAPRFGDTSEWDTAAGQCILEEAGGSLVNLQGEPLVYNAKESLLNPHFLAVGSQELFRKIFENREK